MLRFGVCRPHRQDQRDFRHDRAASGRFQAPAAQRRLHAPQRAYYWRRDKAGAAEHGFQSDSRHGNPYGFLHGGAVIGFLDTILGNALFAATKRKGATVSLDSRFVSTIARGKASGSLAGRS